MNEFKSYHRNAQISPRKVRPVADLIRGLYADEALDLLKFQPQRGAAMLYKVLESAVGNAQDPDQNGGRSHRIDDLVVTEVMIDGGAMFKRIRPRARGMAFGIKKRSSHIRVALTHVDEL